LVTSVTMSQLYLISKFDTGLGTRLIRISLTLNSWPNSYMLSTIWSIWYNDLTFMGLSLLMRILDMYTAMMFSFN